MGAWDPIWDSIFAARQWGKYPKEELIRFVARHYYAAPDRNMVRFLDLGCGFGASTWFLAREGFSVDGIDGSQRIIDRLRERLAAEGLTAGLVAGDAIDLPYRTQHFDCVIDIACLQHNNPEDTRRILDGVFDRLKPGGRLFSFTAMAGTWGDGQGRQVGDCTYSEIAEGPFANAGTARFSTEAQIRDLYGKFELQLDVNEITVAGGAHRLSNWIIEGVKC
jgi:SAM-dependent methyltransferase